jgi:hypothetical protein
LQQLPTTWDPLNTEPTSSVIEFGALEDDDADEFESEPTIAPIRLVPSPTNAFEAIGSATSFSYLDEEFGSSIEANSIEQKRTLRINEPTSPSSSKARGQLDLLEIEEDFELPTWSSNGKFRSPIASMGHIEADPFGTDFEEEIPLQIQPIANVANPIAFGRDPDMLLQSPKPSMSIPILGFDEEPVLAIENLEHEIRELITGLNYNSLDLNLNAPIEWQSTFGPSAYPVPPISVPEPPSLSAVGSVSNKPMTIGSIGNSSERPLTFKFEPVGAPITQPVATPQVTSVQEDVASEPITKTARLKLAGEKPSSSVQEESFASQAQVLSFAKLGQKSTAIGDDRDLLVIEEEVSDPTGRATHTTAPSQYAVTPQSSHSYVQLFSMLRG